MRDLTAKIEELQQEAVRVKSQLSSRDNYMERRFLAQEREINTLQHKGWQFCKPADSAPKHAKRSFKNKQTIPRLTTEEVLAVEMEVHETTNTGIYQSSLGIRGQEKQPVKFQDESMFYNWKCVGSLTYLKRSKITYQARQDGHPHHDAPEFDIHEPDGDPVLGL